MEPSEPQTNNGNKKALVAFILVLAVVIVAVGVSMFGKKDSSEDAATTPSTSQTTPASGTSDSSSSQSSASTAGTYKDGTYNASGSYMTPGGQQKIGVTVTLKDGVVTDTSLQQTAENEETQEYQGKFASGYEKLVVGKKIDQIQVSRVSGSSLTSQGFHNALDNIEQQAKS